MRIGQQIKALRIDGGIRVSDMAGRLGLSEEDYLDIESGAIHIQAAQLAVVAARLNIPVSVLYQNVVSA